MNYATLRPTPLVQDDRKLITEPIWLPTWHNEMRAAPKALLRSALFTCADKRKARRSFDGEVIASVSGQQISYSGTELRQDDLTVWLHVVHLQRADPVGQSLEVAPVALLDGIGWGTNAAGYQRLRESLMRLSAGDLRVDRPNRKRFHGRLLQCDGGVATASGSRQHWKLRLDPNVFELFTPGAYTLIDPEERRVLSPLAQWLNGFYATHTSPYPYKAETLHSLCGSTAKSRWGFRRNLFEALEQLHKHEIITDYLIEGTSVRTMLARKIRCPTDGP